MLLQQHTYKQLGLALNIKKTQVLYLPPLTITAPVSPPNVSVNGTSLEIVGHFTYFRSLLSPKANIDEEVHLRLNSASVYFPRLRKRVFENQDLQARTKILHQSHIAPKRGSRIGLFAHLKSHILDH